MTMAIAEIIDETLREQEAQVEPQYQARHVTVRQVEEDAHHHLNRYVHDNLQANGADPEILRQLSEDRIPRMNETTLGRTLQQMGDELWNNRHFQNWIGSVPAEDTWESFKRVAEEIFADGNFNMGRVAALFCFAGVVCLKAIQKGLGAVRVLELLKWTMRFFRERVAPWVVGRGGWDSVDGAASAAVPFISPAATSVVKVGVFLGVMAVTAYILYGRR